jgi:histidine triad (HIT) family protein
MKAFSPARIGLIVAGFEVPHTHLHVIPMRSMADISFENAARSVTPELIKAAADAILANLNTD